MAYTNIDKSSLHFNAKLYTGTGAEHAITGVGFQPDLVWTKRRDSTSDHHVHDAIRGATYKFQTNDTGINNSDAQTLKSFDSDGFTLGTNTSSNASSGTFVSWNWKGANGTASNTDGSITSTVSANTTAGFSIVKWTATGSNATIGHGLGAVPKWIWIKSMANSTWHMVYHAGKGNDSEAGLNSSNAFSGSSTAWQDTTPTSSVFYVSGSVGDGVSYSGDYMAYCWADVTGFSKFSSYIGNGSNDGSFIYTGFKPKWVMIKKTATAEAWHIYDGARNPYNLTDKRLFPESTNAESVSGSPSVAIDLLSNGFKNRALHDNLNTNGSTYVYMAFAEAPLVGSNNVPCTAR